MTAINFSPITERRAAGLSAKVAAAPDCKIVGKWLRRMDLVA